MPPPSYFFHLAIELDDSTQQTKAQAKGAGASQREEAGATKLTDDWRYSSIELQTMTMQSAGSHSSSINPDSNSRTKSTDPSSTTPRSPSAFTNGISTGLTTKARFEPLEATDTQELGWGIIRLYRDGEETEGLYDAPSTAATSKKSKGVHTTSTRTQSQEQSFRDEDCTTLCIIAVPSYMTPSDFLGFVGEKTREAVSHFRMVRTGRGNRYMVLMKFRNGKAARTWRREWNGRQFDGMEPENMQVVFIKSISFSMPSDEEEQREGMKDPEERFPDMRHDPFTPSVTKGVNTVGTGSRAKASTPATASRSSKPAPPPTPSLVELPTCPVCLERMDESTGLLTILCQHVFHCSCLQKWRGSGCPVCRYTQDGLSTAKRSSATIHDHDSGAVENECRICHAESNLWICLICGHVGCGRYDLAHAFAHYEASGHCFAMDMDTQRVWDYGRDGYVHRILQDKSNGKFLELEPSNTFPHPGTNDPNSDLPSTAATTTAANNNDTTANYEGYSGDMVPQEKLHTITLEYTALLTSQLDSQRAYFEDVVARTADKASRATSTADALSLQVSSLTSSLSSLQTSHSTLTTTTLPTLQRDLDRSLARAATSATLARDMTTKFQAEQSMNAGLMKRIHTLQSTVQELEGQREGWQEKEKAWESEKRELGDQNRDLMMFLEGREKVKELEGTEVGEEVREGFVEAGPAADGVGDGEDGDGGERKGRRRKKGKK